MLAEEKRLQETEERAADWRRWGPFLSERQWGTVREDYSADGDCWNYFPHEHARSRAYRWGEDGLLGICDRQCRLCFALSLWNGRDPFLKERLFGLTGPEGNHGEDVKEQYFYLDSTPTHSYFKALYKYPQAAFPYQQLLSESRRRTRMDPEFEIEDTGVFDESRYFDIFAEYAKRSPQDILIRITCVNRGPDPALLHLLPTIWFRNTWSWGCTHEGCEIKPRITHGSDGSLICDHASLGRFRLYCENAENGKPPPLLLTENETNSHRLFGFGDTGPAKKDAFHDYIVGGDASRLSTQPIGTKAAYHFVKEIPPGGSLEIHLRLAADAEQPKQPFDAAFGQTFASRISEADAFYAEQSKSMPEKERKIARQAYAGLLWSKQFYHYSVRDWLHGDPDQPTPPEQRLSGRNSDWKHLFNRDIISMPDKWEYPWYAAWDLAFHMLPMADVDPEFAKSQLLLLLREWYMHPNGQIPAYEFNFSDVNPPVHAWASWRVYKIAQRNGERDRLFLARAYQKLLLNFNWWVNRKDQDGRHLFSGGFLGLDNIGVFDRSRPLPTGGYLEQADGTAWMAFYCSTMLAIAIELAKEDPAYEDLATKFFEHFVAIVDAMNCLGGTGLWDEEDGFYYDQLHIDGDRHRLKIRSMVGLIPLIAVEVADESTVAHLPEFRKRTEWFLKYRSDLAKHISYLESRSEKTGAFKVLLAAPSQERLRRVLRYLFDEKEFLSPYGIRSLSAIHREHPFTFQTNGEEHRVDYVPGESNSWLFGGNSNWRGPIWFPVNYLLIESLERYHHFYGDDFKVEFPTGSGKMLNLKEAAREISRRLSRLFLPGEGEERPCHGGYSKFADDPHWKDLVLFHEYFNADTGKGLGATHQTGWTALIARILASASNET